MSQVSYDLFTLYRGELSRSEEMDSATIGNLTEVLEELGYALVRGGNSQAGQAILIAVTALMKSNTT